MVGFSYSYKKEANFSRKEFQIYLEEREIQTRVVFTGNILRQPMCKSINKITRKEGYPNADSIMERGVLLPLHHGMKSEMFERLHSCINEFITKKFDIFELIKNKIYFLSIYFLKIIHKWKNRKNLTSSRKNKFPFQIFSTIKFFVFGFKNFWSLIFWKGYYKIIKIEIRMSTNVHSTQISNVLIIGCGGAGLRCAIEAKHKGVDVSILGKRPKTDAHTVLAAGGINAALGNLDKDDSWQHHFSDTYLEGYGIGDPTKIEIMAKESPSLVKEIDNWGANFAKLKNGNLDQRFFGAHRYRRTCYSGDFTGFSILRTLLKKANELNIPIYDDQYVTELLVKDNICFGAMSFNIISSERTVHLVMQLYFVLAVILEFGKKVHLEKMKTQVMVIT